MSVAYFQKFMKTHMTLMRQIRENRRIILDIYIIGVELAKYLEYYKRYMVANAELNAS